MAGVDAFVSYLRYERGRYARVAGALVAVSIAAYAWHSPTDPPNGGTWLGYTLGTVAALLIVWLAWLGVRKRQYGRPGMSVSGWTSAHVYLGLSLIVIGTLHCGFQFGWNIHTLAYGLMMLVIASGVYGIIAYARFPARMTRNRSGTDPEAMLDRIMELDDELLTLAERIDPITHARIARTIQTTRLGGGLWAQLRGTPQLASRSELIDQLGLNPPGALDTDDTEASARRDTMRKMVTALGQRSEWVNRLNRDITQRARMRVWLWLHVPTTIALLVALVAHIFSVFFYW